ncbi:hypothetical protein NSK11_contig00324-0002 [Nocardia seriolae]|uniref:Uncharacterized protein n=1 Tax=Nocardia seriolae TaxID=37332 RepID=A0ABC9Z6T4_9NOCA|nr:hypothetical protein NSK11_contig00324-0002 [Nocardia seriolae]
MIDIAIQDDSKALFYNAFRDGPSANRNRAGGFRFPRGWFQSAGGFDGYRALIPKYLLRGVVSF